MSKLSTFLFAEPSFAEGMARVLDLFGTLNEYNASPTPQHADARALGADLVRGRSNHPRCHD